MLKTMATCLIEIRKHLDDAGLSSKKIVYTTRYNSFWNVAPDGWKSWNTDGEAKTIHEAL